MLVLQNISYSHLNKELLFSDISLTVQNHEKVALIGNNGSGKSTLLKIIAGDLSPSGGFMSVESVPYFVPQIFGQFNHLSIAQALGIDGKLAALKDILDGSTTEANFNMLNNDWTVEVRCAEALNYWQLEGLNLSDKMEALSGGQKTRVFLAGIQIYQPDLVLLDEPSNHLDIPGREILYDFIESARCALLVVSHDRKLLNMMERVCELSSEGIKVYGGIYDFYKEQKLIENNALSQDIQSREKALRKAREKERETLERQQRSDNRGKAKQVKSGVARIMMNTLRNNAENSTSKLKSVHAEKIEGITRELLDLRSSLPEVDRMKIGFDNSALHRGKVLFKANDINFAYGSSPVWTDNLTMQIVSGERIALKGRNGSGKTTLINLITGKAEPGTGSVYRSENKAVYVDQDYSLLDNRLSVYEQAQQFNIAALQEHEVKIRLSRFLFSKNDWDKSCGTLSGGERMRLMLCCLTIYSKSPDILVFDEPTNNLDIQNVEILTAAINEYQGTLIVVSHDETFIEQIGIDRIIEL